MEIDNSVHNTVYFLADNAVVVPWCSGAVSFEIHCGVYAVRSPLQIMRLDGCAWSESGEPSHLKEEWGKNDEA